MYLASIRRINVDLYYKKVNDYKLKCTFLIYYLMFMHILSILLVSLGTT